jgi:hypothetical protein
LEDAAKIAVDSRRASEIGTLEEGDREPGFVSAFTSLYVVVTLVAYTLVVLFLA